MANVILEHLVKDYPDKHGMVVRAVDDIGLTIADGEFMVLVGPSGCGKSTTLRMIAGLEEISGGTVTIDGRVVNEVLPKDRDIAMVFQNYALYPHMSVYDNMAFGLKLRKLPKPEIDRRVREAAAFLGLETLLDRKPKTLSGGQRQRVALGRAIVRQPKVFLFDEPLSNLDAKMRVQMRAEIAKLHARLRTTMIYVTHDQVEAMTMGDRICVMKDGHIMQIAEPLELYNRPANLFVAGFIGSPPMNFLKGTLRASPNGSVEFVEDNTAGPPAVIELGAEQARKARGHLGRPVVFGLRPEDVAEATATSHPRHVIEFNVGLAEPLGPETYLYLTTGAHNLVVRMPAGFAHFVNRTLRLCLAVDRAHLFDTLTEEALV